MTILLHNLRTSDYLLRVELKAGEAAVNSPGSTIDVARALARQENGNIGNLLGDARTSLRGRRNGDLEGGRVTTSSHERLHTLFTGLCQGLRELERQQQNGN